MHDSFVDSVQAYTISNDVFLYANLLLCCTCTPHEGQASFVMAYILYVYSMYTQSAITKACLHMLLASHSAACISLVHQTALTGVQNSFRGALSGLQAF